METTSGPAAGEIYTNGYDVPALNFMRRRTRASHGRFIEPWLHPGLRLLDLGCGPGTITRGLAECVAPGGSVMGVDQNGEQFSSEQPGDKGLNLTFCAMNVYQLELANASFDGVFSHALFEHLARPLDALREVWRVLKPGGFAGLRSPDWGGFVAHPCDDRLRTALEVRTQLQTRNGGNVQAGRHLGEWLRQAGFTGVRVTANYEIYEDNTSIVEHIASQMENAGEPGHARTWRSWGENPQAMFAQAWFEAVGCKPG